MIHRTLRDAQDWVSGQSFASWQQLVIVTVTLRDGRQFWRTYRFDQYRHKCRRCRKAANQHKADGKDRGRHRLAASGHTCPQCGNPFAAFVRQGMRHDGAGRWTVCRDSWFESGRLH